MLGHLFLFLPTSMDGITLAMNLYWIDSLLTATLGLKPSTSSNGIEQTRCYCYYAVAIVATRSA